MRVSCPTHVLLLLRLHRAPSLQAAAGNGSTTSAGTAAADMAQVCEQAGAAAPAAPTVEGGAGAAAQTQTMQVDEKDPAHLLTWPQPALQPQHHS